MMVEERKDGSPKGRDPSSRGLVYDSCPSVHYKGAESGRMKIFLPNSTIRPLWLQSMKRKHGCQYDIKSKAISSNLTRHTFCVL
jgi:hypothetical protein